MKKFYTNTLLFILSLTGISNAQQIIVGTGTALSVFSPINRSNDYSVYEIIYLTSEINASGMISKFAFERADGTEVGPIENVDIYMQNTSNNSFSNGNYSNAGYTLVYSGSFPNDSGPGWREVTLDNPFMYDGINNLAVLTVKGYQPKVANTPVTPRWYYTLNSSTDRARRYYGNDSITSATSLTTLNFNSNARLDFGTVGIREIIPGTNSVYPNPSSGSVNFNLPTMTNKVLIYNSNGQMISELFRNNSSDYIVENLKPGIYFYEFIDESGTNAVRGKFIVQ